MLSISRTCRYFLYRAPCDMRYGLYSLVGLVRNERAVLPIGHRQACQHFFVPFPAGHSKAVHGAGVIALEWEEVWCHGHAGRATVGADGGIGL